MPKKISKPMTKLEVVGVDTLINKLERLGGILSTRALQERTLEIAKKIADDARRRAPIAKRGHWQKAGRGGASVWVGPGSLKRGIVAKEFKSRTRSSPAAFVAIDYSIAPHAHLVEYGARGGEMPAQPFFRPAIDTHKQVFVAIIKDELEKQIEKVAHGIS